MSSTTIIIIVVGVFLLGLLVLVFSMIAQSRLRTVPKPVHEDPERTMQIPAELRAARQLQQACYNNDPEAASLALAQWAWASGEVALVNRIERNNPAPGQGDIATTAEDLWRHLDSPSGTRWYGYGLWNALIINYPQFQQQRQDRIAW